MDEKSFTILEGPPIIVKFPRGTQFPLMLLAFYSHIENLAMRIARRFAHTIRLAWLVLLLVPILSTTSDAAGAKALAWGTQNPTPSSAPASSPGAATTQPPTATPNPTATPTEEPSSDGESKDKPETEGTPTGETPSAAKPAEAPKNEPLKRPTTPPAPPDRKEFDVRPDEEGMVQFNFRHQGWPDVLRWIAEVSHLSLDWQELPNDFVNIATQRKYSLDEARDLFNSLLLARGYTMLESDGIIQVVKTEGINAALVPKVSMAKLDSLPPHRFVRVLFSMQHLLAEEMVEELQTFVSKNGKLNAYMNTNRLEVMDSVANLREIANLIKEEQGSAAIARLAKEFEFEHVRAADVKQRLSEFLGLSSKTPTVPEGMNPEQAAMLEQQQIAMQQQQEAAAAAAAAANAAVTPQAAKRKRKTNVYLVANVRQNSLLVHAPPDQMAIIQAFIEKYDVPSRENDLNSLQTRMRVYRLQSLAPEKFIKSLLEIGALEPTTKLEADKDNKSLIAYASVADHMVIQETIERLDGSAREFEVVQLRRLRAEKVAGTIKGLMVGEKKEDNSRRRPYYFSFWDNEEKKTDNDEFRITANTQDNQLLIWANESEKREVLKLLDKLGETPQSNKNQLPIMTLEAGRDPQTLRYLKQLQQQWNQLYPNELVLPPDEAFRDESEAILEERRKERVKTPTIDPNADGTLPSRDTQRKSENSSEDSEDPDSDEISKLHGPVRRGKYSSTSRSPSPFAPPDQGMAEPPSRTNASRASRVSSDLDAGDPPQDKPHRQGPPIRISVDAKGNLVATSDDPKVVEQLEALMRENPPPPRPHTTFIIKHARPSWIKLNLIDYFKDQTKPKNSNDNFMRWLWDMPAESDKKEDPQLGEKNKVRFMSDNPTKTLMVIGADEPTMKIIRELIEVWDVPVAEADNTEQTKMIKVQYSKAESIVEAIKDAYRDLLSATDRTFAEKSDGKGEERSSTDSTSNIGFGLKGELSLGVDKVTNTIILTTKGERLMKVISQMITDLDEAARPSGSIQVTNLSGGTNMKSLEKAIKAMMRASGQEVKEEPQAEAQAAAEQENQNKTRPGRGGR